MKHPGTLAWSRCWLQGAVAAGVLCVVAGANAQDGSVSVPGVALPTQPAPSLVVTPADIAAGKHPALMAGEFLTYDIGWGFITAGHGTLEVSPKAEHNGITAWQVVMTAKTTSFMDKIYKIRDRYTAWFTADLSRSLEYDQKQHEGDTIRDMQVIFDAEKLEACRVLNKNAEKPVKIQPGTFDPLASLFFFRSQTFKVGDIINIPVSDGKFSVMGTAKVIAEEKVETDAGEFDTYKVEPDTKDLAGVFKKSKGAKLFIWVTKDARHLPVKISSKVFIGSFTAELTSIKREGDLPAIIPFRGLTNPRVTSAVPRTGRG